MRATPTTAGKSRAFRLRALIAVAASLLLSACDTLGYYSQAVSGQLYILTHRQKIDRLLNDPATDPQLKTRLNEIANIRRFAADVLGLPVESQYSTYVDLERPFVVWNVFAAPVFSLDPQTWCYPVAGCVSYRGYFAEATARAFADDLRAEGLDVYVGGIAAYSTLGWFSDPVLNTLLNRQEHQLAALVFHELAHQVVYLPGDTEFNESFATAVEREGQRRWLQANMANAERRAELAAAIQTELTRQQQFVELVQAAANDLRELYAGTATIADMQWAKEQRLQKLRADYAIVKTQWQGYSGYDSWFAGELNNAQLATVTTYNNLVPAFTALLAQMGGDMPAFYKRAAELADMPADSRRQLLIAAAGVQE